MLKEPDQWQKMKADVLPKTMQEKRTSRVTTAVSHTTQSVESTQKQSMVEWMLDPKCLSSRSWLVRVLARARRVLFNMRNPESKRSGGGLDLDPIASAFAADHKILKSGKTVSANSPLSKLNPKIDEDGIIRSDGRLKFAEQLHTTCSVLSSCRGVTGSPS